MEYMQGTSGFYVKEETAVTMGKFDGLHRGHQKLMRRIRELGRVDCKSLVFTLNPMEKGQILTDMERKSMAEKFGMDYLLDCPLTPEIMHIEPEDFIAQILMERIHARYLVVGSDFRFGYKRKGDYHLLMELQKKYGYQVEVMAKEQYHGRDVSSTYVREELAAGHIETVNRLLGYPYFIQGEVLPFGAGEAACGRSAISLAPTARKLLPPKGVYETKTIIQGGAYPSITNVGEMVKTELSGCDRELMGETVWVEFYKSGARL
jgi:riboflavin kinase/FMN adenylyltransferase